MAIQIDVDFPNAHLCIDELESIPKPNWITVNPNSLHCHAVWLIDGIAMDRRKSGATLNSITHQICQVINKVYAGATAFPRNRNATQNPDHPFWKTIFYHNSRWSFADFIERLPEIKASESVFSNSNYASLGRNCYTFVTAITELQRKHELDYDAIASCVYGHALASSCAFNDKGELPSDEVTSITRSIIRYAEKGYAWYAARKAAAAARTKKAQDGSGIKQRAEALGLSKSEWYRRKKIDPMFIIKRAVELKKLRAKDSSTLSLGNPLQDSMVVRKEEVEVRGIRGGGIGQVRLCHPIEPEEPLTIIDGKYYRGGKFQGVVLNPSDPWSSAW